MHSYYDIHTHSSVTADSVFAIYNHRICYPYKDVPENNSGCISAGIHPWDISVPEQQFNFLKNEAVLPSVVAIGEAGLDKLTDTPPEIQIPVFKFQAKLAEEVRKPLIIHCVKSWQEMIRLFKEVKPTQPWIIHGFRGNDELAGQLIHLGLKLSFGKFFNEQALKVAWPENLFVETDDSNDSIDKIYNKIVLALGVEEDEFKLRIRENVNQAFCL